MVLIQGMTDSLSSPVWPVGTRTKLDISSSFFMVSRYSSTEVGVSMMTRSTSVMASSACSNSSMAQA
jgi:hypothetical protein